ncbi:hypothetical protein CKM354_000894500 [Cercospora kikuchii]|uniref:Protein kinase domain-containing protein n=1 Tax=Cercospora kikuchii TaxID=84275 RepID=A0A9P3CWS4_9PEZI|nr:uncharacterized protein CKM354_000894500 [Cercospora kikuchii]GIZ45793.1 hypothetical protein CKM354_000894500 [Cercospora kikuchii]
MTEIMDLVRRSKLDAEITDLITKHVYHRTDRVQRSVRTGEKWKKAGTLGRGGFGEVYLEKCLSGNKRGELRAVKKLYKSHAEIDMNRELFAIALFSDAKYEHCFVQSLGWYEVGNEIYIAMEYLQNGHLRGFLTSALPEEQVQNIVSQALEGVDFMHQYRLAHRDLKPENILVVRPGPLWWVKLADFGISKRVGEDYEGLKTQIGTTPYVAPEVLQLSSEGSYSLAVDLWSMGVVTLLLLTGRTIFPSDWQVLEYAAGRITLPLDLLQQHQIVNESGCNFLRDLLQADPERRQTASFARKHEWLQNLHDNEDVDEQDGKGMSGTSPNAPSAVAGVSRHSPSTASNSWSATELQTSNIVLEADASTGPVQWPATNDTSKGTGAELHRGQDSADARGVHRLERSQTVHTQPKGADKFNAAVAVRPGQWPAQGSKMEDLKLVTSHEGLFRACTDEAAFATGPSSTASGAMTRRPEAEQELYKPPLRGSAQTAILPSLTSRGEPTEKLETLGVPPPRWQVVRGNQTKQDLRSVDFSADGRWVLVTHDCYNKLFCKVYDTSSWGVQANFQHDGLGIIFSPDRSTLAWCHRQQGAEPEVRTWLLYEKRRGHTFAYGGAEKDSAWGLSNSLPFCYSLDSCLLATVSRSGSMIIWKVSSGQKHCTVEAERDADSARTVLKRRRKVCAVVFSSSGEFVACGGHFSAVVVRSTTSGAICYIVRGHEIKDLWFSCTEEDLLFIGSDNICRSWNLPSGKQSAQWHHLERNIEVAAHGKTFKVTSKDATSPDAEIEYQMVPSSWVYESGSELWSATSANGTKMTTAIEDELKKLWDGRTGVILQYIQLERASDIHNLRLSLDRSTLIIIRKSGSVQILARKVN